MSDLMGPLLARASGVLREEVRRHVAEGVARTQLDAVAEFIDEVGGLWMNYLDLVILQNAIFEGALTAPSCQFDELGQVTRQAVLLRALGEEMDLAHAIRDETTVWRLREALLIAAEAERDLIGAVRATMPAETRV